MSRNQYQTTGVKQIVIRSADTGRVARATFVRGFKGWTVIGEDNGQRVGCMNGASENFRRSDAVRMCERFVNTGCDFL